ncbi:LytR C-terminal domain-containing protein [Amycolatopsis suaedae]|uniref:LytR family transcriptional regulator n=1 Tax=Amycolatopsis suaedae TaxID=2510978 RepID=A0A4Q7J6Y5_9PSEU|nr:LytR C-terminal domain-containing protein [Amycolatopsis suaedae]RZQ61774.1 LytR family transcriptional regulator [Amycolatopsis suaedae]
MSWFNGLSRPLRLAGFVLVGVAVVAAVIGGVTAVTDDDPAETAAPSPTAPSDPGSAQNPPPAPPSSSVPPSPPAPPPSTSSVPPPSPSTPPPGPPGGDPQAAAKRIPVRVYNNSTIHGLGARAGDDLRASGWNVAEVSNYPSGIIPTTTAYYRPGTEEEAAARALAAEFGMRAEPRFEGIQHSTGGVIVIVTNDYGKVQRQK